MRVKHRCQLLVRLKANKCYQELLCYLSSYINLLSIRLLGWLLVPDQFQTSSPWSRPLVNSGPHSIISSILAVIIIIQSIAFWLILALIKVVSLVKLLFLVICLQIILTSTISCSQSLGRLVLISQCFWYCFIGATSSSICKQSKTKFIYK